VIERLCSLHRREQNFEHPTVSLVGIEQALLVLVF
jgi:hypothetical protein